MTSRPSPDAPEDEWTRYIFDRRNVAGQQREWWYHRFGCRKWFTAMRDTMTNEVHHTAWPEEAHA